MKRTSLLIGILLIFTGFMYSKTITIGKQKVGIRSIKDARTSPNVMRGVLEKDFSYKVGGNKYLLQRGSEVFFDSKRKYILSGTISKNVNINIEGHSLTLKNASKIEFNITRSGVVYPENVILGKNANITKGGNSMVARRGREVRFYIDLRDNVRIDGINLAGNTELTIGGNKIKAKAVDLIFGTDLNFSRGGNSIASVFLNGSYKVNIGGEDYTFADGSLLFFSPVGFITAGSLRSDMEVSVGGNMYECKRYPALSIGFSYREPGKIQKVFLAQNASVNVGGKSYIAAKDTYIGFHPQGTIKHLSVRKRGGKNSTISFDEKGKVLKVR